MKFEKNTQNEQIYQLLNPWQNLKLLLFGPTSNKTILIFKNKPNKSVIKSLFVCFHPTTCTSREILPLFSRFWPSVI